MAIFPTKEQELENRINRLEKQVEHLLSASQKTSTSDEALPIGDVVLSEERAELCNHRWEDLDNFSDRRICEDCGKIN